jgi:bifunctional aspartokinase / homoserine dehydrogenase 1
MIKVMKFGGTSVGSAQRVRSVADIISASMVKDQKLIIVVSAVGGITDELVTCATTAEKDSETALQKIQSIRQRHFDVFPDEMQVKAVLEYVDRIFTELTDIIRGVSLVHECSPRTLDLVLSFGERLSARLMTALLINRGVNAIYVDARECVVTNRTHGGARVIMDVTSKRVKDKISNNGVYVVTGFIAATADGITTTFGRGGSDYTAALFGSLLHAAKIEIWTDVDGFMSADPRLVKEAFVLPKVNYEEAMELSYFGAKVIHPRTLVPAIKEDIPVLIKNSFAPEKSGTVISPFETDTTHPVKGIASISGITMLNIQGSGMVGVPGISGRLFSALAAKDINVIMITQASSEHSICFVVQKRDAQLAREAIEEEFEVEISAGKIDRVEIKDNLAIIAAVGENMHGTPGIAGKLFGSLGQNSINVIAIAQGSSERNVSLVVKDMDMVKAVNVIHSAFYLSHRVSNLFIVGPGSIGSTLLSQIKDRQKELAQTNDLILHVCGLGNSKRMIIDENGVDLASWKELLANSRHSFSMPAMLEGIKNLKLVNSILVDVTDSEEVARHYLDFLKAGIHVVTPNKKANSMDQAYYNKLIKFTEGHRLHYYYEATVGAGLPIINTIKSLKNSGDEIIKIEGILSGTLSYLFTTLSAGRPFSDVVHEAFEKGYTEPDPRQDLSGIDVARKLLILAREIGLTKEMQDVHVQSLIPDEIAGGTLKSFWQSLPQINARYEEERKKAEDRGLAMRYIASLADGRCKVAVEHISKNHLLAQAAATDNIIQITTKRYFESPLTIQGPGAGREVTAGGVFADIISLSFHLA